MLSQHIHVKHTVTHTFTKCQDVGWNVVCKEHCITRKCEFKKSHSNQLEYIFSQKIKKACVMTERWSMMAWQARLSVAGMFCS